MIRVLTTAEMSDLYKRFAVAFAADPRRELCGIVCASSWHDPVACAFRPGHDGDHSWASIPQFEPAGERTAGTGPAAVDVAKAHDGLAKAFEEIYAAFPALAVVLSERAAEGSAGEAAARTAPDDAPEEAVTLSGPSGLDASSAPAERTAGTGPTAAEHARIVTRSIDYAKARTITGTPEYRDLRRADESLAALVALAERQREVLARFRDAWFEWDGEYEPLDAAASEAMTVLDDEVLVLTDKGRAAAGGAGDE